MMNDCIDLSQVGILNDDVKQIVQQIGKEDDVGFSHLEMRRAMTSLEVSPSYEDFF